MALTSGLESFETEMLTQEGHVAGLAANNRELISRAQGVDSPQRALDMDSTDIPVYGQQEHSPCNHYLESIRCHPLLFDSDGLPGSDS